MKSDNCAEIFPLVDEDGCVIGSATRGECHDGSKKLHPVVHLHLFDKEGRLYLQQRPLWKEIQPGKWDTAVGGHVDYGEEITDALRREVAEELGITSFKPQFLVKYIFESEREKELIYVYRTTYDGEILPSDELDGGRFWSLDEIHSSMGKGVLTPNFEQEFMKLKF
jgi:isopentenyldiphosphate isomerase